MDLVIDANILFAALIKDSSTIDIILNENIHLFAPEFLLEEFYKHQDEILKKTKRSKQDFESIFENLKSIINIIPLQEFRRFFEQAQKEISDEDDVPYLALALRLNIPVWSNDKRFQMQKAVKAYTTEEMIKLISP